MAGRPWTTQEDELIKIHYLSHSSREIAAMLPGRTRRSVDHRIGKLGIANQRGNSYYERRKDTFNDKLSKSLGRPFGEWLRQRYIVEQATYRELCAEIGINTRTLMRRMKEFGIEPIDNETAGKRNYEKHKEVYRQAMDIRNDDEVRRKSAQTRQKEWRRFASHEATVIIEELQRLHLNPIPEYAIHRYNIDIAFPDIKLGIEVDGGNWHQTEKHLRLQAQKEAYLKAEGWAVLRVTTRDTVTRNIEKITWAYRTSSSLKSRASTQPL